ncbi:MAG: hypothetical protein R3D05_18630 [Dongiaceae bacterium]
MRLDAVTVSVYESDSLALTLANRNQFDRWLIVTVRDDRDTIRLCRDHGLECHLSAILRPDGEDVLAGTSRNRALEEGVDVLGRQGWTALISSYVLLPRLFRAQFDAMTPQSDTRYGLRGYRRCTNRRMLERLAWCEPWHADLAGGAQEFQLQLIDSRRRDQPHRATLPMDALLLADSALHWGGDIPSSERVPGADYRGAALARLLANLPGRPTLLIAGRYPGLAPKLWAPHCGTIVSTDDFCLDRQTDGGRLQHIWRTETAELATPIDLDATGRALADRSVDVLYIPGEASVDRVMAGLPLWRRTLKRNAIICGDLFGRPDWAEATIAIAELLGTPDDVEESGFWRKRIDPAVLLGVPEPQGGPCVVLNAEHAVFDSTLVSLHTLRRHWAGSLMVHVDGAAGAALAAACVRYGTELCHGAPPSDRPYLAVDAGTLAMRPIGELFDAHHGPSRFKAALRQIAHALRKSKREKFRASITDTAGRIWKVPVKRTPAVEMWAPEALPTLVRNARDPRAWKPVERQLWSDVLREALLRRTTQIRVGTDSTIVVMVGPDSIGDFALSWASWNFGAAIHILVVAAGIRKEELEWSGRPMPEVLEVATRPDFGRLLEIALQRVQSRRTILLPPGLRAMPGAELFVGPAWRDVPLALHTGAEVRRVNGALPLPRPREPLLLSAETELLRRLCARVPEAQGRSSEEQSWLRGAVKDVRSGWQTCNVERWGWRIQ